MCFTLRFKNDAPKPLVAKKKIKVFKVISKDNTPFFYNLKIDKVNSAYEKGYIYIEKTPFKGKTLYSGQMDIHKNAFHSYRHKANGKRALVLFDSGLNIAKLVKMFIPKGALYYKNNREYVSSEIYFPGEEYKKKK